MGLGVGRMLRQLCEWRHVNIIEGEVCVDYVQMLVEIPPDKAVDIYCHFTVFLQSCSLLSTRP